MEVNNSQTRLGQFGSNMWITFSKYKYGFSIFNDTFIAKVPFCTFQCIFFVNTSL